MKLEYTTWDARLFDGFYDSALYNYDLEASAQEMAQPEDDSQPAPELELNWKEYTETIARRAVELIADECVDGEVIKSMEFDGICSPAYYNFETDKLQMIVDYDEPALMQFIKARLDEFAMYLKEHFTSYDGFISFIPNNLTDFFDEYSPDNKLAEVALEWYILKKLMPNDSTDDEAYRQYKYYLYDDVAEVMCSCLEEVKPEENNQ